MDNDVTDNTAGTADVPNRAGRREWLALALLTLPCLLVSMDAHVLNLAVPRLTVDLRPSGPQLLWILDSYVFLVAGSLLLMGVLGDRIGRRRLLLIGATGFGLASLLAAFSTSPGLLIAARALLGVAGATLMPSTLALIRAIFRDPAQQTTALAVWTGAFSLGGVIGPIAGGFLLTRFWWGSVFLIAVPVMVCLLLAGPAVLPESRAEVPPPLDLVSAGLSLVSVLAVVYGIKQLAQGGAGAGAVVAIAGGLALGAVFLRRQRTRPDPFLDLSLFRRRTFSVPLATTAIAFFVLYGTQMATASYLQLVLGLSPLSAALWSIPGALGFLGGSALAPSFRRHARPAVVVGAALALTGLGFGLLGWVGTDTGLGVLVIGSVIASIGLAPVYLVNTQLTIGAAPTGRAGTASAVSETGAELGGALGIAVLGSILGGVYRHAFGTGVTPDLPATAVENARRTLGGALASAQRLPAPIDTQLIDQARAAFVQGFHTIEVTGAALVMATAVVTALLLRRVRDAETADTAAAPKQPATSNP